MFGYGFACRKLSSFSERSVGVAFGGGAGPLAGVAAGPASLPGGTGSDSGTNRSIVPTESLSDSRLAPLRNSSAR